MTAHLGQPAHKDSGRQGRPQHDARLG
jgi:hypothetical protein